MIQPSRRQLITGLVSLIAAPAIVRVSSLMPVKSLKILTVEEITRLSIELFISSNLVMEQLDILYGYSYVRGEWFADDMKYIPTLKQIYEDKL